MSWTKQTNTDSLWVEKVKGQDDWVEVVRIEDSWDKKEPESTVYEIQDKPVDVWGSDGSIDGDWDDQVKPEDVWVDVGDGISSWSTTYDYDMATMMYDSENVAYNDFVLSSWTSVPKAQWS